MKHKQRTLTALLLLGLGLTDLQAQTLYVNESNGDQTSYALNDIAKMTFSTGNLTVTKTDNSSGIYALSEMKNLRFSNVLTSADHQFMVQDKRLITYPNPVAHKLMIDLSTTTGEGILSIISFNGNTVLSRDIDNEGVVSLDISHLANGIYVCRYSNATGTKTVKIIKQ